ncbi:MAG TPA: polysaccharide deacetylase family protein [Polyangiaceae bacterium]|nr:polysaccharide deacetylase family protein [Polyangiaceae bacterium]
MTAQPPFFRLLSSSVGALSSVSPARFAFWASSSGLSALAANAVLGGRPGAFVLSAASLGWGALVTSGVFFPWLEMYGGVVCRGPRGRAEVALTFDDGPHPDTTAQVLRVLEGTPHRATFFVLGQKVRKYPELARAIVDGGHTIAIHGDTHDRLHSFRTPWRVRDELVRARDSIEAASGKRAELFRPPLGHTTPATLRGARSAGVTPIGWSARGYDGIRGRQPEAVVRGVTRSLDDGAIVLLHDAAENDDFVPAGVVALPALLDELARRKLESVALERWFPDAAR